MIQTRSAPGLTSEVAIRDSRRKDRRLLSSTTIEKHANSSRVGGGGRRSSTVVCVNHPTSPKRSASSSVERGQLRGVTLNIGAAASARAAFILEWLRRRDDDLIVLTETSPGPGTELLSLGLAKRGYEIIATPASNDRGVLIASRLPVRRRLCAELAVTLPWRAAGIVLDTSPSLAVVGVYVPSRDRTPTKIARKEGFIRSFLNALETLPSRLRENLLIAGDYNVISRRHNPPRRGYFSFEYAMHESLERLGFAAGHELGHRGPHPYSWVGRTGDGYLYDYVHLGGALHSRLGFCEYVHDTRQRRLSDHAAVAFSFCLDED
jgi:exodeoxyribonuclease-3